MDAKYYAYHFARLHTARYKGKAAPHKAVLLLAVMQLVEQGKITSAEIELTDELVAAFKTIWVEKLPASCPFTCDIGKPFYHMQHEPFWRLVEHHEITNIVADALGLYNKNSKPLPQSGYGVNSLRERFQYAKIDNSLYEVLKGKEAREELRSILISHYLNYTPPRTKSNGITLSLSLLTLLIA